MIVVETLHHVSISVVYLERAKRFYQVVLGLPGNRSTSLRLSGGMVCSG